tara:strand:- start:2810 stop:2959 length:150 start_codon:yes stop_codon:yes gene_type:complete
MFGDKEEVKNLNHLNIDPVEHYFECISLCDITDGKCISQCVEILRDFES